MMRVTTLFILAAFVLSLGFAGASYAESDIGFKGIGGRIGYVDPESEIDGTITFGVVADLGEWTDNLRWDAALTYWSTGEEAGQWEWTWSDIALRSGVKYHFLDGEWQPYAGGGLGIHMYSIDFDGPSTYTGWDDSETEFGFYIVGGVSHQFNEQWKAGAELQLDWADPDQTNIQVNVIYLLGK
ncbi:MAG: acyloxyacyl hydrolase [Calditrichota bacterium]